jgi:hypothetical protein
VLSAIVILLFHGYPGDEINAAATPIPACAHSKADLKIKYRHQLRVVRGQTVRAGGE